LSFPLAEDFATVRVLACDIFKARLYYAAGFFDLLPIYSINKEVEKMGRMMVLCKDFLRQDSLCYAKNKTKQIREVKQDKCHG